MKPYNILSYCLFVILIMLLPNNTFSKNKIFYEKQEISEKEDENTTSHSTTLPNTYATTTLQASPPILKDKNYYLRDNEFAKFLEDIRTDVFSDIQDPNIHVVNPFKESKFKNEVMKKAIEYQTLIIAIIMFVWVFFLMMDIAKDNPQKKVDYISYSIQFIFLVLLLAFPLTFSNMAMFCVDAIRAPCNVFIINDATSTNFDIGKIYNEAYDILFYNADWWWESIDAFFSNIDLQVKIWAFELLIAIQEIAAFVLIFISDFLVFLVCLFFPIVIAFSFIKGFGGGIKTAIKYVIVIALWQPLARTIVDISKSLGTTDIKGAFEALKIANDYDLAQEVLDKLDNAIGFGSFVTILLLLIMLGIVPKIADILISGAQSGSFFSIVTTAVTGALSFGTSMLEKPFNTSKAGGKTAGETYGFIGQAKQVAGWITGSKGLQQVGKSMAEAGKNLSDIFGGSKGKYN